MQQDEEDLADNKSHELIEPSSSWAVQLSELPFRVFASGCKLGQTIPAQLDLFFWVQVVIHVFLASFRDAFRPTRPTIDSSANSTYNLIRYIHSGGRCMETLDLVLSWITTILALITSAAAVLAPVYKAKIDAKLALRLKELDTIHSERARAYHELIGVLGACRMKASNETADQLHAAVTLASVYSSADTAYKLRVLAGSYLADPRDETEMDALYISALEAMSLELSNGYLQKLK